MPLASPLALSQSNIKVYNAAMAELGVPKIGSFTENSQQARVGNAMYGDVLEAEIAAYPWRFARRQMEVFATADPVPLPWAAGFILPASALAVHALHVDGYKTPFDVYERMVVSRLAGTKAEADVSVMVSPDVWAAYFRRAFIAKLAASVCMAITMDERLTMLLEQKADRAMAFARSRDAQGRSPSRVDTKAFVRARRGGRY